MASAPALFRHPCRIPAALVLAAALLAACDRHPVDGEPEPKERERFTPLGVVEVTITGVDGETPTATAVTPNFAMTAPANGGGGGNGSIQLESAGSGSFTEGTRGVDGARYVYATFRVRNAQSNGTPYDTPRQNLTFVAVGTAGTFAGTAVSLMRRFDGTNADPSIATNVIPTGALGLSDSLRVRSLYPDVLQVFTEAEAAAIPVPAGVTNVFPYGFVARHRDNPNSRTLAANPAANQFDGVVTFAFRIPLQPHDPSTTNGATKDVFTFSVQLAAFDDSETRLTESIEEQSDEGRAAAMARATALGATTVTVLAGSPAADPAVPDYPGQRQICAVRTAGTSGASMATITAPGPYAYLGILNPGETLDWCAPYFRTGTPSRPATNVPYTVEIYAMDRYGNVRTAQTDVVSLAVASGPAFTPSAPAALTAGEGTATLTYHDYGMSGVRATGTRLRGIRSIFVAGVTRTWTAGAGTTDWHTGANWSPAAVPMSQDSVIIPLAAPLDPVTAANVSVQNVYVEDGARIDINAFDLTAAGDVYAGIASGQGIVNSSGRLILSGTAKTVQGRLPRMRVTGTYTLTGNINGRAPLEVSAGRLTNPRFRVQIESF